MQILNCTDGTEKPVELGKKAAPVLDHLFCYKCDGWGNHLPSECNKQNPLYSVNKIINAQVLEELPTPYIFYYCAVCNKRIDDERIRALIMLGKNENEYKCVACMEKNDYKVKGFYSGVSSSLNIVKKLGKEKHFEQREETFNTELDGGYTDY